MVFELESADRMRHMFDGIGLSMREIVRRVDAPFIRSTRVFAVNNTVHDGVAKVDVARSHINLGANNTFPIGEFSFAHARKEVQAFFCGSITVGAIAAWFS